MALLFTVTLWLATACSPTIKTEGDALLLMGRSIERGNYDKAIKIGDDWLRKYPTDGYMYAQVGLIYLDRANQDNRNRERYAREAIKYANNALVVEPQRMPTLEMAARVFLHAGNMLADRCANFKRAQKALDELATRVDGGTEIDADQFKRFRQLRLDEIAASSKAAHCEP